ncbi:MAG: hypothetical protein LBN34_02370 [Clostridiales Family XIII bacterium]|nr:hypothetical protein [Clostridiales Family XIII bacterium]
MGKIWRRTKRNLVLMGKGAGMELVQVAILVAIAIVIGLIFRTQIESFVNEIFENLSSSKFK